MLLHCTLRNYTAASQNITSSLYLFIFFEGLTAKSTAFKCTTLLVDYFVPVNAFFICLSLVSLLLCVAKNSYRVDVLAYSVVAIKTSMAFLSLSKKRERALSSFPLVKAVSSAGAACHSYP